MLDLTNWYLYVSDKRYGDSERKLPYCEPYCFGERSMISSDGKYRVFFENVPTTSPSVAPYCIFGIKDDEDNIILQKEVKDFIITMCAISDDGEIAVFLNEELFGFKMFGEETFERRLFLAYRNSKNMIQMEFKNKLKTNFGKLLGLEIFSAQQIIRCYFRGCHIDYNFNGEMQNNKDFEKYLYYNGDANELVKYICFLVENARIEISKETEKKINSLIGEIENVINPEGISEIYNLIGKAYQELYENGYDIQYNLNKALAYYKKALSLFKYIVDKGNYHELYMIAQQYEDF